MCTAVSCATTVQCMLGLPIIQPCATQQHSGSANFCLSLLTGLAENDSQHSNMRNWSAPWTSHIQARYKLCCAFLPSTQVGITCAQSAGDHGAAAASDDGSAAAYTAEHTGHLQPTPAADGNIACGDSCKGLSQFALLHRLKVELASAHISTGTAHALCECLGLLGTRALSLHWCSI